MGPLGICHDPHVTHIPRTVKPSVNCASRNNPDACPCDLAGMNVLIKLHQKAKYLIKLFCKSQNTLYFCKSVKEEMRIKETNASKTCI